MGERRHDRLYNESGHLVLYIFDYLDDDRVGDGLHLVLDNFLRIIVHLFLGYLVEHQLHHVKSHKPNYVAHHILVNVLRKPWQQDNFKIDLVLDCLDNLLGDHSCNLKNNVGQHIIDHFYDDKPRHLGHDVAVNLLHNNRDHRRFYILVNKQGNGPTWITKNVSLNWSARYRSCTSSLKTLHLA